MVFFTTSFVGQRQRQQKAGPFIHSVFFSFKGTPKVKISYQLSIIIDYLTVLCFLQSIIFEQIVTTVEFKFWRFQLESFI